MNGLEPADETDLLRFELADLGFLRPAAPEECDVVLRSPESFTRAEAPAPLMSVPDPTPTPGRQHQAGWRRPALVAAAALSTAAAVATALLVIPHLDSSEPSVRDGLTAVPSVSPIGPPGATSEVAAPVPEFTTVAQVFDAAAESAGKGQDHTSTPNYWRVEARVQIGDENPYDRSLWLGRKRKGLLLEDGEQIPLTPASFGLAPESLTWEELQNLPTNPASLRDRMLRDAQNTRTGGTAGIDWAVINGSADLFVESPLPAGVRRALWKVLASSTEATLIGTVTDAEGREGQAVRIYGPDGSITTWTVDVTTGNLLEIEYGSRHAGELPMRTTYLQQGPADHLPSFA